MIKTKVNRGDIELEISGTGADITAEYIMIGRAIAQGFIEKGSASIAKTFEDCVRAFANDNEFTKNWEDADKKEDGDDDLVKALKSLKEALKNLLVDVERAGKNDEAE